MLPPRSQSQHVFHLLAAGKTNSRQAFTLSVRSGQWGEPNSSEPGVRSGAGRESKQKLSETLPHPMEQPLLLAAPDRPGGGIQLSPRGLEALRALSAPVHVVAALGPPGGGSVFLMNQLAGPGCGKRVAAGRRAERAERGAQRGRRSSDPLPTPLPYRLPRQPRAVDADTPAPEVARP